MFRSFEKKMKKIDTEEDDGMNFLRLLKKDFCCLRPLQEENPLNQLKVLEFEIFIHMGL